jgi:phosphate transport system substrate-binding protein
MWQQEKKDNSIVSLALGLALATTPMAATMLVSAPMLAQSAPDAPSFSLPQTVDNGTTVRIDGSNSLATINQSLKENFEKQFSGTKVEIAANGTDTALKALLDGNIDIAAIGRGLTPKEKAQGLEQVRLRREKVAIIVSAENPFKQSLTSRQFARIFRGRITDWSELGRSAGKIRVIDRPATSDTRENFRDYPAFKTGKFATGSNATQLAEDNTAEIIKKLGKDGISYVLANQVSKLQGVRVLRLHQTLPDDSKYPFSQPLVYVYKKNPSPNVASFLGFTLAPPGQQAIEQARATEAEAIASSVSQVATQATPAAINSPNAQTTPAATASPNATTSAGEPFVTPAAPTPVGEQPFVAPANNPIVNRETPFWLLLPLFVAAAGGLVWWFLGRRPSSTGQTDNLPESPPSQPSEETIPTTTLNASVASPVNGATSVDSTHPDFQSDSPELASLRVSEASEHTAFSIYNQTPSDLAQSNNDVSNLSEGTTAAASNGAEHNIGNGGAALIGGVSLATGAGAALWSAISGKETDQTKAANGYAGGTPPESSEVAWDIEAPAAVVNNSYPQLPNVPEEGSDAELPASDIPASILESPDTSKVTEVTSPLPELPDVSELAFELEDYWDTEVTEDPTEKEFQAKSNWIENISSTQDATLAANAEADILSSTTISGNGSEPKTTNNTVEGSINTEELPGSSGVEISSAETTTSIPELLDMPEEVLNVVADAAEPTADLPQVSQAEPTPEKDVTQTATADFVGDAALAAGVGMGAWASVYGVEETAELNIQAQSNTTVDTASVEETFGLVDADEQSSIVFTPRTPKWAYACWYVPDTKKEALRQEGGSQLVVRLYDVTDIDLSYQNPQLVQQYESEETTNDGLVAIPVSDRDYITEIGYITDDDRWLLIARSPIVHVFDPLHTETTDENVPLVNATAFSSVNADEQSNIVLTPRTPKWAYVYWYLTDTKKEELRQQDGSQLIVRLYDVTDIDLSYQSPQLVQQYECEEVTRDRFVAIPVSDRDYMAEIGYATDDHRWLFIARSGVVRAFSRPHGDSWFVADAELIIHGATEPNTTVTIGGDPIKIKPDGTFHLRIPFSDGLIDYLMTVASNGEPTRTIHKKFSQETSTGRAQDSPTST